MTAEENYSEHVGQIQSELSLLKAHLNKHYNEFINQPTNWGFVGDLGNVLERLKEINLFMKPTSTKK